MDTKKPELWVLFKHSFNICMSLYKVGSMSTVCVFVCGRYEDMKEEGPLWCLYVTQCQRGNDFSLSPTQGRQRRSTADYPRSSAFFSPSTPKMQPKPQSWPPPPALSHSQAFSYAHLLTGIRLHYPPSSPPVALIFLLFPSSAVLYLPHAYCLTLPPPPSAIFHPPAA